MKNKKKTKMTSVVVVCEVKNGLSTQICPIKILADTMGLP